MTEKQQIFAALYVYTHALECVRGCKTRNHAYEVCIMFCVNKGICYLLYCLELIDHLDYTPWIEREIRDGSVFWYDTPSTCDNVEHIIECLEFRLNKLKELYYGDSL